MQPAVFSHVRNAQTPHEAWNNLKKAFEDSGLCRRLGLLRSVFATKLNECDGMEGYLNKITSLSQQLQDINAPLDDEFVAVVMLSGLTSDYDPLIMALENSNLKLTSDVVKGKLLQEYQRRDEKTETAAALVARKQPKCFKCKKVGHFIKDCPKKNFKPKETACSKALISAMSVNVRSDVWYIDSGATSHMCNNRDIIQNFVEEKPKDVNVANGEKLQTAGRGNVQVCLNNCVRTIGNVYYVPNLSTNLLSVSTLVGKGYKVSFSKSKCVIFDNDTIVATATLRNGVYQLDTMGRPPCKEVVVMSEVVDSVNNGTESEVLSSADGKATVASQDVWHRRLGHLNSRSMALLKQGMVTGINYSDNYIPCIACVEGKQNKLPFPKKSHTRATQVLELVHTDLCGPMPTTSFSGAKYFLLFIDDFTRKTFVYFLKSKNEVFEHFKTFKALVQNQTDRKIKVLRSDNGGEYINFKFQAFLKLHGIRHQTTVPHTPQQNGVAERANRTVMEKARCMLQDAGLDNKFWAEAVNTAVYLKNRTPTKAVMGFTPEEKWTNKKVNLAHLHIFGCIAYAMTNIRKKLDPKAKPYLFVGYCEETKGYRLLEPSCPSNLIISRNVKFFENKFYKKLSHDDTDYTNYMFVDITSPQSPSPERAILNSSTASTPCQSPEQSETYTVTEHGESDDRIRRESIITVNDSESDSSSVPDDPLDETYVPGDTTMAELSSDEDFASMMAIQNTSSIGDEPTTVREALSSGDSNNWRSAMADEYQSFLDNDCWTLTERPKDQKPVKCKWVFKRKFGLNGEILKYKARLVAKGCTQQYGIDYEETFSPVVRYSTIRTLLAVAAEYSLNIDHLDVKTAFLNGDLKETVYMEQPEGYVIKGKENQVYKLKKAIYGLKQASKSWYEKINSVLIEKMNFTKHSSEPCIYFQSDEREIIIIALYVDDILLFSSIGSNKKAEIKSQLMKEFEMKDLSPAHQILGMRLIRKKDKITLDQSTYIKNVLERFNMLDCKPANTPMEKGIKFTVGKETQDKYNYRNLIGCLMYIAVCTRPDISHAVSVLSQFNDCYTDEHWKAAKRVLRYLKGTINYSLSYQRSGLEVTSFVDADWAASEIDRKSYTGYVFKLGSSVITWESRKQKTVALSSTEAEYMAMSDACKEALFVRTFLYELLCKNVSVTMYNDSQSAQKLCSNPMYHARTKHIDVRHHFIRGIVNRGTVVLKYLSTDCMTADILTKPLTREKHEKFVKQLGLSGA